MSEGLSIGIEEEYLLVDPQTRSLASRQPEGFMTRCQEILPGRVTYEFLQSQVEIGTGVCQTVAEARAELIELREAVASCAREFDTVMVAASTHPWSLWSEQSVVDMERYRVMGVEHASIARRMAICGMHVHAGVEDRNQRVELMGQMSYFMPHLLALSTSSPFWEGLDTGLKAIRPTIAGNLPRSGLPERFDSWSEWSELLDDLSATGMVTDPSKIWWDLRPSVRHPTLEMRICDVCTRVEDGLTIAALYQSILAFLCQLRENNQRWRQYRRLLIGENKWRAQRYGIDAELGDFGRRQTVPLVELIDELIELVRPHAEALGCLAEVEHAAVIVRRGTSADDQLRIYKEVLAANNNDHDAQIAVVDWLIDTSVDFNGVSLSGSKTNGIAN